MLICYKDKGRLCDTSEIRYPGGYALGDTVYILEYCDGCPFDYCGKILVAGNETHAILAPIVNGKSETTALCEAIHEQYMFGFECDLVAVPWEECYDSLEKIRGRAAQLGIDDIDDEDDDI